MRIAICDDIYDQAEHCAKFIKDYFDDCHVVDIEIEVFTNPQDLISSYSKDSYPDILVSDIQMPEIDGIDLAVELRKLNPEIIPISFSYYIELAPKAVRYGIFRYVNKDNFIEDMTEALESACKLYCEKNSTISIKTKKDTVKIRASNIVYIESFRHILHLHMINDTLIEARDTLDNLSRTLSQFHFVRVQKSYVVNLNYVTSIKNNVVTVCDTGIPISRDRYKAIKEQYYIHKGRML